MIYFVKIETLVFQKCRKDVQSKEKSSNEHPYYATIAAPLWVPINTFLGADQQLKSVHQPPRMHLLYQKVLISALLVGCRFIVAKGDRWNFFFLRVYKKIKQYACTTGTRMDEPLFPIYFSARNFLNS